MGRDAGLQRGGGAAGRGRGMAARAPALRRRRHALRDRRRLDRRHAERARAAGPRASGGLEVVTKTNTGHGRTCVHGYRLAIARGARWILQIDSDGQCDAAHFPELWRLRADAPARVRGPSRPPGRLVAAAGVAGCSRSGPPRPAASGCVIPNVPYRLMSSTALRQVIDDVPDDVDLVNVYLAVALAARARIRWVDIVFRERLAGRSHRRWWSMIRPGLGGHGASSPGTGAGCAGADVGRRGVGIRGRRRADGLTIDPCALRLAVGLASLVYVALPVGLFLAGWLRLRLGRPPRRDPPAGHSCPGGAGSRATGGAAEGVGRPSPSSALASAVLLVAVVVVAPRSRRLRGPDLGLGQAQRDSRGTWSSSPGRSPTRRAGTTWS